MRINATDLPSIYINRLCYDIVFDALIVKNKVDLKLLKESLSNCHDFSLT